MLISTNLHKKSSEVSIKTRSPPASFSFKGQATKHTTIKMVYTLQITTYYLRFYVNYDIWMQGSPYQAVTGKIYRFN